MSRRKKDAEVEQPEVVAGDDEGLLQELAVENQVAVREDAEENQEEIASGDVEGKSVEEVEAFNEGARASGDFDEQVQAPADPERGTGSSASDESTDELLPSDGDYSGVRDPNYQFQEVGKVRLVEGRAVDLQEAAESAEGGE